MIVPVDGGELSCTIRGRGPACIVLTAIGAPPYVRMMPAELSHRLTLVIVELRGSGRSTGDPADLTFDVLAADLEAVRAAVEVERIAVMGHSILGALAIEYGRHRPDRVSHVIAVGTPTNGDMAALSARAAAFFDEDASDERKRLLRENLARLSPRASPGETMLAQTPMRFFDPRFDAAPLFEGADARPYLLKHLMATLLPAWDVAGDVESLRVPMLVAHGRYDYTVPHAVWDGLASTLPGARLHLFERSGHQPFFEEPDRFAEVVMEWMAGPVASARRS
jgi:proline iminopeptidase